MSRVDRRLSVCVPSPPLQGGVCEPRHCSPSRLPIVPTGYVPGVASQVRVRTRGWQVRAAGRQWRCRVPSERGRHVSAAACALRAPCFRSFLPTTCRAPMVRAAVGGEGDDGRRGGAGSLCADDVDHSPWVAPRPARARVRTCRAFVTALRCQNFWSWVRRRRRRLSLGRPVRHPPAPRARAANAPSSHPSGAPEKFGVGARREPAPARACAGLPKLL